MLAETKRHTWKTLLATATEAELAWMNGYLEGLLSARPETQVEQATPAAASGFTILFGTETGNAKSLATRLAATARKEGHIVKLAALDQYRPRDLEKESRLFVVISTQGDGEPPAQAQAFYDYIHNLSSGLGALQYAVLALGDTAYPLFCKTGEDVDLQLERAGGRRFAPLLKCDTDYETAARQWFAEALAASGHQRNTATTPPQAPVKKGKQIYTGSILSHINLNDTGSAKATYHIELEAENFHYEPGDAIGIVPSNPETEVQEIISLTGLQQDTPITYKGTTASLQYWLGSHLNITYLPARVVKQYAALSNQEIPEVKLRLAQLLSIYPVPAGIATEAVINILEPVSPRLYSIASAPTAHNGTVHITVSKDRFYLNGQEHTGLCSGYLSGLRPGMEVSFYLHANKAFRLPAPEQDLIMIGPGTGIAPFRSFLAEREATGASGRNWLFFGDQHFSTDFLYQSELQSWHETGLLQRINVAFSRDQEEKIYVQHKMLEQAADLYEWLENGAGLYICGAKDPMSIDVENTLLQIIATQGNRTEAEARAYLGQLKDSARYHKDVY